MTTSTRARSRRLAVLAQAALLLLVEYAGLAMSVQLGRSPAYRIGWSDPGAWLATSPAPDVAVALLRPAVLALSAYLLAVTVAYGLTLLLRPPHAAARIAALTPRGVRRVAERVVAVTLLTATSAAPAAAATGGSAGLLPPGLRVPVSAPPGAPPSAPADVPSGAPNGPPDGVSGPALVLPHDGSRPADTPLPVVAPPRRPAPAAAGAGRHLTVVRGDSLWSIAARVLAEARHVPVGRLAPAEVAGYWVAVVEANRATLRSGDPDLIHPGETIRLPDPAGGS